MSLPLDARPGVPGASPQPDQTSPVVEQPQTFEQAYADLESYFELQLHSPTYESVDYTLDEGAELSFVWDIAETGIFELLEGKEIRLPSSKFEVSIPLPEPDTAFIRLSDDAQGRVIRLGLTFDGMPDEQASTDFGIEINLAETDGAIGIFESHTSPDESQQRTEERVKTEKAQLTPEQLHNISQILHKYSPSGNIYSRRRISDSIIQSRIAAKEGKGSVLSEDGRSYVPLEGPVRFAWETSPTTDPTPHKE